MKNRKALRALVVAGASSALWLTGCSSDSKESQIERSCIIVNGWPVDYAQIWPAQVKNAASRGSSPGREMSDSYIQVMIDGFEITDPTALRIVTDYQKYWILLEEDLVRSGGELERDSRSTQLMADLLEECEPYADYE